MSATDQVLALARAYAEAEDISLSTVSWRVFGDTKKLSALETGADLQTRRYEGAVRWFAENWPGSAAWPSTVAKPTIHEAAAS